jgi:hypothetical protein
MTDGTNKPAAERPAKRGEAAWKAALDEVAERNEKVSKIGRDERAARERREIDRRRAVERLQNEQLAAKKLDVH